jgi:hypothetical protein
MFEPGKKFISRRILHQHWYTCPVALPVRRNPKHRRLLTVVSATSHLRFNLFVMSETFATKAEPLYASNISHHKQETFLYEYPLHWVLLPKKRNTRTLIFGITLQKHGHHFDYWNQLLNMRMRVCFLDCHEAGLCCYLVHYSSSTYICDLFTDSPSYVAFQEDRVMNEYLL